MCMVTMPKVAKASAAPVGITCSFACSITLDLSSAYIGEGGAITPVTMTSDSNTLVLALATLGGTT